MDEIFGGADHLRDPNRRWLRHTYQEGPGFRFLATRGGRPPERRGVLGPVAVVRQRARLVRLARGFDNVPALAHLTGWLEDLRAAA